MFLWEGLTIASVHDRIRSIVRNNVQGEEPIKRLEGLQARDLLFNPFWEPVKIQLVYLLQRM